MWLRPALLGLRLHRGLAALLVLAVVLLVTLRRLSVARGARVAVVLYGTRFHRLELTGASIARAIPPTADVFVFGHDQLDAAQHVKAAFGSRVVHMHLQSQLPARAVQAMLDAMRSPPSEDPLKWSVCVNSTSSLLALQWMSHALSDVFSFEALHGVRYDWVFLMRPDMLMMAPLPPVQLLDAAPPALWVTDRFGWGGIAGGLIACPRALCHVVHTQFDDHLSGTVVRALRHVRRVSLAECNVETVKAYHYAALNVRVGVFADAFPIVCDPYQCAKGDQCVFNKKRCADSGIWKYPLESKQACIKAARLTKYGWREEFLETQVQNRRRPLRKHCIDVEKRFPIEESVKEHCHTQHMKDFILDGVRMEAAFQTPLYPHLYIWPCAEEEETAP